MADYVSALNGQQMDAALMDMALHNSEAWAVGTRNGYEVESDDITWENNAKYYASVAGESSTTATTAASSASESASTASSAATEASSDATRAEDAADRAEAIVGGQFVSYGQTQGLTDAYKMQARANISAGASNRNLLDNPWFTAGNVVNQRGVATIPNTQYGIDRWKGEHRDATITVTNAGLAYQGTSPDLYQPIESSLRTLLNGKKLTASVLKSDGTIESGSAVFTNGAKTQFIYNSATGADVFISAAGNFNLRYLNRTSAVTVVACKLELGSYSTLANDVPPKKRSALADCQERFLRVKSSSSAGIVGFGSQTQSDRAYILIPTPVTMELNNSNTMSATLTGTARLVGNGSGSINVTSVSFISKEENGVLIACFGSNIAANVTYNLYLTSGSYIDISGDL